MAGTLGSGSSGRRLCAALLLLLLASTVGLAQTPRVRVAIVTDGPADRERFSAAVIEREVANVTSDELGIALPQSKRFRGDWTLGGINAALDRALNDKDVDVVLALRCPVRQEAAHRQRSPSP